MHYTTPWYRRKQRPKRALLERQTHNPAFHYGVYDNAVWSERAFSMSDLHFLNSLLRFYFVKIKSRKTVSPPSGFSLKVSIWDVEEYTKSMRLSWTDDFAVVAKWIYYYMWKGQSRFIPFSIDRNFPSLRDISWIKPISTEFLPSITDGFTRKGNGQKKYNHRI